MKHAVPFSFALSVCAACATTQPPAAGDPAARSPTTAAAPEKDPAQATLASQAMDVPLEPATIHFGFDSDSLDDEARKTLGRMAKALTQRPDTSLVVEGHCDDRGTTEYNLALGERRARVAREYMVRLGAPASIKAISYGEARPVANGSDEAAWARNRRGELVPQ